MLKLVCDHIKVKTTVFEKTLYFHESRWLFFRACHVAVVALKGQNGLRVHYVFYETLELQPTKKNSKTKEEE